MKNDPFWFVWNPNGHAPTHKHSALHSAVNEAERLARLNRGQEFVVLASVCAMKVYDIHRVDLRAPDDEIPF